MISNLYLLLDAHRHLRAQIERGLSMHPHSFFLPHSFNPRWPLTVEMAFPFLSIQSTFLKRTVS